ncbi:hypothetical protein ACFX14_010354 [Malus domestica]
MKNSSRAARACAVGQKDQLGVRETHLNEMIRNNKTNLLFAGSRYEDLGVDLGPGVNASEASHLHIHEPRIQTSWKSRRRRVKCNGG